MGTKVIHTILSLKDEMTSKLKPVIIETRNLKRGIDETRGQLNDFEEAQKNAQKAVADAKKRYEEVKASVLSNNTAYQSGVAELQRLKQKNQDLEETINNHERELGQLSQTYNSSKDAYNNAKKTLESLTAEYGENSDEVKDQKRVVDDLKTAYDTSKTAYNEAKTTLKDLKNEYKDNNSSIKAYEQNLDNLKSTILSQKAAVKVAENAIERLEKAEKEAGEGASKARSDLTRMGAELARIKKESEGAKEKLKEFGKEAVESMDGAIKRAGQLAVATATATTGFAVKTGLETAFNLEAFRTQLETATKDVEKTTKLIKMAQDLSVSTPYTPEETIQSTAKMEALGVDSQRWLRLVADMAGATNKEMEQATDALTDMLTKQEFEGIEEFGINKDMITDKANEMFGKNKVIKKNGELRKGREKDLEKVIEALMTEKFEGGSEKLSKTVKGLWSTITGATSMSLAKIFGMENGLIKTGSLLDMIRINLQKVATKLTEWQNDGTLDMMAQKFTETFNLIIDRVTAAYGYIKENKETIMSILKVVVVVYTVAKAFMFLSAVISAVKVVFLALNVLFLNPAFLTIAGVILTIVAAGYLLYKAFQFVVWIVKTVWNVFSQLTEGMPLWAKILLAPIAPIFLIVDALQKVVEWGGKAWGFIKSFFSDEDEKAVAVTESIETEDNRQDLKMSDIENQVGLSVAETEDLNTDATRMLNLKTSDIIKTDNNSNKKIIEKSSPVQKKVEQVIDVTITGDFYGYEDFKEKVAGVFKEIINYNVQNTV
jgi:predicted  nucleic acid-binding Zn-ribbon protein